MTSIQVNNKLKTSIYTFFNDTFKENILFGRHYSCLSFFHRSYIYNKT